MTVFDAAIVQMRSGTVVADNVASMKGLVTSAAKAGASYVQTPEMTGLVQQSRKEFFATVFEQSEDPLVKAASELASELGIYVHIGSTPIRISDSQAANRAFLFAPDGRLQATYDKIHMFDVDLDNGESWRESAVYRPGTEAVATDVNGAKLGIAICYDLRFPRLHNMYAQNGVEILTGPSCFTRQTGQAHWHALMRSRAIETGSFMIAAAQGGDHEDGRTTYGHSLIVNPWGEVIAEVSGEEPGFDIAKIDTEAVLAARNKVPNLKNERDFSFMEIN